MNKENLARLALSRALRKRKESGVNSSDPICIYDLVEKCGVEVWFTDTPSMEGMYCKNPGPNILISSLRPSGRQVFTCGHEFGHHVFNHGIRIDNLISNTLVNNEEEEFLANSFSGFLLMPKQAVWSAFSSMDWNFKTIIPTQIFVIAGYLGVGYSTLINHMWLSLDLISPEQKTNLLKFSPKTIKQEIMGQEIDNNLIVVQEFWKTKPIDIQVGDYILVSQNFETEGYCIKNRAENKAGVTLQGVAPGIGRIFKKNEDWGVFVRVSRKDYIGNSKYRHLEDNENEQTN